MTMVKYIFLLFPLICLICFAQNPNDPNGELTDSVMTRENKAVSSLSLHFTIYQRLHPDVPITNLAQVLEESFREFGTNNLILEKYVFMPPGMIVKDGRGEIVLMSAQPFSDDDPEFSRAVVTRVPDSYLGFIMPERRIQKLLAETGLEIPKPEPTEPIPPPPPSPKTRWSTKEEMREQLEEFLKTRPKLRKEWGLDEGPLPPFRDLPPEPGKPLITNAVEMIPVAETKNNRWWLIGLLLVGMAAFGIYFWRRGCSDQKK